MAKAQFMATSGSFDSVVVAYSEDGNTWVEVPGFYAAYAAFNVGATWFIWAISDSPGPYDDQTRGFWKSTDMETWIPCGHPGTYPTMYAAHCANGMIIGVGENFPENGYGVGYTYDMITWTPVNLSGIDKAQSVTFGNGRWVVTSTDSVNGFNIWYSDDGKTFTQATGDHADGYSEYINDVAFGNGVFIASAMCNYVNAEGFRSTDGITWTRIDDYWGTPAADLRTEAVAYGDGVWVLGGKKTTGYTTASIYYSTDDGVSWSPCTIANDFSQYCEHIVYNEILGMFVAIGSYYQPILYSSDGITWTKASDNDMEDTDIDSHLMSIAAAQPNALFVAVGAQGAGTSCIIYTNDGINWLAADASSIFTSYVFNVAFNGIMWIAAGWGNDDSLAYSYNGMTWYGLGTDVFVDGANAICWSEELGLWVSGGDGETYNRNIAWSEDGITWTYEASAGGTYFNGWCTEIEWNGSYFLATGNTDWYLYYSYDGKEWYSVPDWYGDSSQPFYDYMREMLWDENNSRWVVTGSYSTYAENTLGYISGDPPDDWGGWGATIFGSHATGIATNGSRIIVVGRPSTSTNIIAYSDNGYTFTGLGQVGIGAGYAAGYGLVDDEDFWLVGGYTAAARNYNIAYSANGEDWTGVNVESILPDIYDFAFGGYVLYGAPVVAELFGPRAWMM